MHPLHESALLAAACLLATAARAVSFDAGADLRIRQEISDNVPGLPNGGVLYPHAARGYFNHLRYRPRVWGEVKFDERLRLYARLTDEFREYVRPKNNFSTWPDEVILDNLYLEGKGLFDGAFDYAIGRQDIFHLYGLDHVFCDGTPGDGSRSVYADLIRFGWRVNDESRLDVFGIYNQDDGFFRWGTDRGRHRSLTGFGGGAEVDMDDWGLGAIWSSRLSPALPYQVFLMEKTTEAYRRAGERHPWTQREMLGAKIVPRLTEEWSLQFEAMGEVGCNGDHDTLSGFSSYAGVNWKEATDSRIRPYGSLGYHFMSGDDDAAEEDGGHSAWDPMWARSVNDSELFLYGTHYGSAWWSNMHFLKLALGLDLGAHHRVSAHTGPMFAAANDGLGGDDGWFKGVLTQLRYDFPLWLGDREKGERLEIFGHVLVEYFNPGDYFETDKPAWFFRWQVEIKF